MIGLLLVLTSASGATPLLTLDFTVSDGGMQPENGLQWSWGEIIGGPADEGMVGTAWATRIDGNYLNDATESLRLPEADLSNSSRTVLAINHWYDMDQTGSGDHGWLEVQIEGTWTVVSPVYGYPTPEGFTGASDGWRTDWFILSGTDDATDVRLMFDADGAVSRSGWYVSGITIDEGDPIPPIMQAVSDLPDTQDVEGPYEVVALVMDDLALADVSLNWSTDGGPTKTRSMVGSDSFSGNIPGMDPGTKISWWITASDGQNTARWPADDAFTFRVYLAAPTGLNAPDIRPDGGFAGQTIELRWREPESPHPISGYSVLRNRREVAASDTTTATVPLTGGSQSLSVAARYSTSVGDFTGDASDPLDLAVALPQVDALEPTLAWQGDTVRVTVEGQNLFMSADATGLDLGAAIGVHHIEIIDANHGIFTISIASDAAVGERDAALTNGATVVPISGGFEIADGTDRPRLLSVEPTRIRQGQHTTLVIHANVPVAPEPVVSLGAGVFVEDVVVENDVIHVQVASSSNAPLGQHAITVDDGTRILDGASVQLRDTSPPPGRVCATAGSAQAGLGGWLCLVIGFIGCRRRS